MKRALVVDNDRFYVELVSEVLSLEGFEVVKAYDGLGALELVRRERPDLIFLDVVMPKIDGDRVCRYLREDPKTQGIPIVILSGTAVEEAGQLPRIGADAYVAKGPPDELRKNLLEALRQLERPSSNGHLLGLEGAKPRVLVKELLGVRRHQEALLKIMGEGVVVADAEHRILFVNPAGLQIFRRPERELIGRPVFDLFPERFHPCIQEVLAGLEADPHPENGILTLPYGERVLRIQFARVPEDASGFFMLMQDITPLAKRIEELTGLNERLRELDQVRSDFLAMVSHDLHTPLTAIKGSLEVLLDGVAPAQQRELLAIAQTNADRLFRMVSDILDLVRMESGRLELQRLPFDLPSSLRGSMDRMKGLALEKGITLELLAPEGLPPLIADPLRMERVFINLLGNAIKFTPPGGLVVVEVRDLPEEVQVTVRDTGRGIPEEHIPRIFERFYRVPPPYGGEAWGTGLGLSICKAIVEEHGGRIWAESRGRGSRFHLTLPKRAEA